MTAPVNPFRNPLPVNPFRQARATPDRAALAAAMFAEPTDLPPINPATLAGSPRVRTRLGDLGHKARVVGKAAVEGVSEFAPAALAGANLIRQTLTATPAELRDREGFRRQAESFHEEARTTRPFGVLPSAADVSGALDRMAPDQPETPVEQGLAFAAQALPFAGEALVRRGLAQRIRQGVVTPPAPPEPIPAQFSPAEQVASLPPEMQTSRGTLDYTGPERRGPERSGSPTELVDRQGADPQSHGTFTESPVEPPPERPAMTQDMVNALGIRVAEKSMRAAGRTEFIADDFEKAGAAMDRVQPPEPGVLGNERGALGERGMVGPLYHGSPHKFDKFSTERVGTGEGAQSYGHGLYFAEREGVAKDYRSRLATREAYAIGDQRIELPDDDGATQQALSYIARKAPEELDKFAASVAASSTPPYRKAFLDALAEYRGQDVRAVKDVGGALYTAELPNVSPDDLLDWDKPLGEQSDKVRSALETPTFIPHGVPRFHSGELEMTASDFLQEYKRTWSPKVLSQKLREAGIRGIRYLDQGSRNLEDVAGLESTLSQVRATRAQATETLDPEFRARRLEAYDDQIAALERRIEQAKAATHNYVVFDDADINILNREGKGALKYLTGLTGAGAGAVTGAATDKEHPLRGALIGGVAGALVGGAGGAAAERLGTKGATRAPVELTPPIRAARPSPVTRPPKVQADLPPSPEMIGTERARLQEQVGPRPVTRAIDPYPANAQDYQVQLNNVRRDPAFTEGLDRKVAELRAEGILGPKQRVTYAMTQEQAKAAAWNEVMGRPRGEGLRDYHGLALRNRYDDLETLKATAIERLKATNPNAEAWEAATQDLRDIELQQRAILARTMRGASQSGRDLNALKYLANRTLDPFVWERKAMVASGNTAGLSSETLAGLHKALETGDPVKVAEYVKSLATPIPFGLDWLSRFTRAGLLSGIKTTLTNTAGGLSRAAMDGLGKPAATGGDLLLSAYFHSPRTTALGDLASYRAGMRGVVRGVREMPVVIRGGLTANDLAKLDFAHLPRPLKGKLANAWVELMHGWQGAIDRPNAVGTMLKSLSEQAKLLAKGDAKVRAALEANPTADMVMQAGLEASYAGYNQPTIAGQLGTGFKRLAHGGIKLGDVEIPGTVIGPMADIIVRFARTPGAVGTASLETAAGPFTLMATWNDVARINRGLKAGLSEGQISTLQRVAVRRFGRASAGTGMIWLGYRLRSKGIMTGAQPANQQEADDWKRRGIGPYNVKMGDRWYPAWILGPLGIAMGVGASLASKDGVTAAGGAIAQQVLQQPMMTGAQQTINTLQRPATSANRQAEGVAGSLVPTIVADVSKAVDPVLRDPGNPAEAVEARVPFASRFAPATLDFLGRPVQRDRPGLGSAVRQMVDFTRSRADRTVDDPLLAELTRLGVEIPADRNPGNGRSEATVRQMVLEEGPKIEASIWTILRDKKDTDANKKTRIERSIDYQRHQTNLQYPTASTLRKRVGQGQ